MRNLRKIASGVFLFFISIINSNGQNVFTDEFYEYTNEDSSLYKTLGVTQCDVYVLQCDSGKLIRRTLAEKQIISSNGKIKYILMNGDGSFSDTTEVIYCDNKISSYIYNIPSKGTKEVTNLYYDNDEKLYKVCDTILFGDSYQEEGCYTLLYNGSFLEIILDKNHDTLIYFEKNNDTIFGFRKGQELATKIVDGIEVYRKENGITSVYKRDSQGKLIAIYEQEENGKVRSTFLFEYNSQNLISRLISKDTNDVINYCQEYEYKTNANKSNRCTSPF